jgi:7,8-dihydropterin-6-yl-methyl-4-(beta-D-ribofuranosyl)aminobenzene 5'-phosphate synthase
MASQQVSLLPVDVADVTILVDNFLDILLPSDEVAHRAPCIMTGLIVSN